MLESVVGVVGREPPPNGRMNRKNWLLNVLRVAESYTERECVSSGRYRYDANTTYVLVARLCNAFNVRHNDLERHVGDERMQANVVLWCQEGRLAFASDVWLCELDSVSR